MRSATITLDNAKRELDREEGLFKQGVVAEAEVYKFRTDYALAKQQVETATEGRVDRAHRDGGPGDVELRQRDRRTGRVAVGPRRAGRVRLRGRHEDAPGAGLVDEEVRLLLADRGLLESIPYDIIRDLARHPVFRLEN